MQLTTQDIQELIAVGKFGDKLEEGVLRYFKPKDYINRQQPRLEILFEIATILEIDVKELLISNKEN